MVEALPMTEPSTNAPTALRSERERLIGRSEDAGLEVGVELPTLPSCSSSGNERFKGRKGAGHCMPADDASD